MAIKRQKKKSSTSRVSVWEKVITPLLSTTEESVEGRVAIEIAPEVSRRSAAAGPLIQSVVVDFSLRLCTFPTKQKTITHKGATMPRSQRT